MVYLWFIYGRGEQDLWRLDVDLFVDVDAMVSMDRPRVFIKKPFFPSPASLLFFISYLLLLNSCFI